MAIFRNFVIKDLVLLLKFQASLGPNYQILSNFNYCLITWHFCEKTSTKKIEVMQERELLFMFYDRTSIHSSLLAKCNYTTLHISCIKAITSDVFKSLNNLNSNFMNEMFQVKYITYDLRDSNIYVNQR